MFNNLLLVAAAGLAVGLTQRLVEVLGLAQQRAAVGRRGCHRLPGVRRLLSC